MKASLKTKYGKLPYGWGDKGELNAAPFTSSVKQRREQELIAFYKAHEPSKVSDAKGLLENYKFEDICASIKKKYGKVPAAWDITPSTTAPAAPAADQRTAQLIDFYKKYEPSKVSQVPKLLSSYKFEDIRESLRAKYKAVPGR